MSDLIERVLLTVAVIWGAACLTTGVIDLAARAWRWLR